MRSRRITRRTALKTAAGAALPLVHIRTAGAAGRLVVLFFDHFMPITWAERELEGFAR